ncbi:hypothetical protein DPEC_G00176010 [Dallia pectoralis]|uniref:Uncharacterized protein n=1 Tax=Dallia pectoralis TaxID=75939 RepID=A0ACC2GEP7_DALPE|nr:hypothetical protein DPEC_G00176010 [Dallia pectoralis]
MKFGYRDILGQSALLHANPPTVTDCSITVAQPDWMPRTRSLSVVTTEVARAEFANRKRRWSLKGRNHGGGGKPVCTALYGTPGSLCSDVDKRPNCNAAQSRLQRHMSVCVGLDYPPSHAHYDKSASAPHQCVTVPRLPVPTEHTIHINTRPPRCQPGASVIGSPADRAVSFRSARSPSVLPHTYRHRGTAAAPPSR